MKPLVIFWSCHRNIDFIVRILGVISFLFRDFLKVHYSADTANYLVRMLLNNHDKDFVRLFIQNKLMTQFVRLFLEAIAWKEVDLFLHQHCIVHNDQQGTGSKMLLCTHTGDYWIAILTIARQYEGQGVEVIVPIYEKITEKNRCTYDKINITGVKVIFVNIHEAGVLLRLTRYLKKPNCVVAIFYDLFCYAAGVYNGSVEPVCLFGKKGHMTTGIIQLAIRMALNVSFVSCFYSAEDKKYLTEISHSYNLPGNGCIRNNMVAWVETQVKRYPSQWHFVANLDTYYHFPLSELKSLHSKNQAHFIRLNAKYSNYNG